MPNRLCSRRNHNAAAVLLILLVCLLQPAFTARLHAQTAPYGPAREIVPADFETAAAGTDTAAGAVVLSDIGNSVIVGNDKGNFSLRFQRFCRILITGSNGFDAASISIPLYFNKESKEQVKDLSGITYNLEGGSIQATKLDTKKNVYTEKQDKSHQLVKFTLPAVKAGSIIEFRYVILSDFIFNLQPWSFQGSYPQKWSEYNFMLPGFYGYTSLTKGNQDYFINSQRESVMNYLVTRPVDNHLLSDRTESFNISANVVHYRWVMKNVPALKEEPFTSSLSNHYSRIEFQLAEYKEPFVPKKVLTTWPEATKDLLAHEKFGAELAADNGWMTDKINGIISASDNLEQRIRKIYGYLQSQFTCTGRNAMLLSQSLSAVYRNKSGTAAEINMLLVALLRAAGISADPVILSLRSEGYTHESYPLIEQYNYVICRTTTGTQPVYLDASAAGHAFGRLPADCYNGHARVVNEEAEKLNFTADSLKESSQVTVFAVNNGKDGIGCTMQYKPGYFESVDLRSKVAKNGVNSLQGILQRDAEQDLQFTGIRADSAQKADEPVTYHLDFNRAIPAGDIFYLNPMFGQGYGQNPFIAATRLYPVEMPFTVDQVYQLELEVPDGYVVDEMPKSLMVKLNEKEEGIFEYRVSVSGSRISLRSRIRISRSWFAPAEYDTLREFFNQVVKKQAEQIVFKRK